MSVRRRSRMIACLLAPTLALGTAAAWPSAAGAAASPSGAVGSVTRALVGGSDPRALTTAAVCPPAGPGQATCAAKALVVRANADYVHPELRAPASPVRFFARGPAAPAAPLAPAAFAPAATGAGQPQPGTPAYLQQAYDLTYLSQTQGAGDTVAVVDAYDNPSAEADLANYRAQFGLPPCTTANGCFRKVNQAGQQSGYPAPSSDWAVEIALDLDAVSALCPRCHIVLVEASTAYTSDLQAAQATANALGAQQISDSWGAAQNVAPGGAFTFTGVATVAAAGDSGYLGATQNQYPAALSGVTAAGGTTLTPTNGGRGFTETAWDGGGSGCDTSQAKPGWQTDTGCTGRAYDDLAADGDPNTGLVVYDSSEGGWIVVGGTSEATPLIAAYYAVTGAQAQSPAWAYGHAAQLNDVLSGSNGSCAQAILYICDAAGGYDGPTGVGSISGAVVSGGAGISGPGPGNTYATGVTSTGAQLQAGITPNGSDTTWFVQYGTTTGYGGQTSPVDIGAGAGPVPVTASLSSLAAGTLYHYRLVAQNAYGTTYGYDATLTTAPPASPTISSAAATVNGQSATLTAALNPQGATTTYRFQYGVTIALGLSSATQSLSGGAPVGVSTVVGGLQPHTRYYYQLFASNAGGAAASPLLSFTTGSAPSAHAAAGGSGGGSATVAIGQASLSGARASVAVACRSGSSCRVRVNLTVNGRVVASSSVTVRSHRTRTIRLRLKRRGASLAHAHRNATRVAVLEFLRGAYRPVAGKHVG